jgi:hypothetical protein
MKIEIKLETMDIEKMLSRIYGFKEGSVKVSINGNGEIIATTNEFPVQSLTTPIYYGPGVRGITTTPDCTPLSGTITTNADPNTKVTLQNYTSNYRPESSMDPNEGHNPADDIMERHFSKKSR